jgi:hypothetical protein
MEKQIENILIKVDEGTMPVQQALSELLRLFNVSGSCNHEFVWLKPDEDDSLDRKCEKCGYVELHDH